MNTLVRRRERALRQGFTLIELMIAIMIISVGMLGMGSVMGSSSQLQSLAISRAEMTTAVENKIEELRVYGFTATASPLRAKIAVGGDLTVAIANYSDSTQGLSGRWYHRRWQIQNGVVGSREVTVRVVPGGAARSVVSSLDFTSLLAVAP